MSPQCRIFFQWIGNLILLSIEDKNKLQKTIPLRVSIKPTPTNSHDEGSLLEHWGTIRYNWGVNKMDESDLQNPLPVEHHNSLLASTLIVLRSGVWCFRTFSWQSVILSVPASIGVPVFLVFKFAWSLLIRLAHEVMKMQAGVHSNLQPVYRNLRGFFVNLGERKNSGEK